MADKFEFDANAREIVRTLPDDQRADLARYAQEAVKGSEHFSLIWNLSRSNEGKKLQNVPIQLVDTFIYRCLDRADKDEFVSATTREAVARTKVAGELVTDTLNKFKGRVQGLKGELAMRAMYTEKHPDKTTLTAPFLGFVGIYATLMRANPARSDFADVAKDYLDQFLVPGHLVWVKSDNPMKRN